MSISFPCDAFPCVLKEKAYTDKYTFIRTRTQTVNAMWQFPSYDTHKNQSNRFVSLV